jgi:hypothetical protein
MYRLTRVNSGKSALTELHSCNYNIMKRVSEQVLAKRVLVRQATRVSRFACTYINDLQRQLELLDQNVRIADFNKIHVLVATQRHRNGLDKLHDHK